MPEAAKIQKPIEKVRETASIPDVDPSRENWQKDNWHSLIVQLFHTPSTLNNLPDAWRLLMKANRAHLIILLREAGAGHEPFCDSGWSSTPTQVWENLAKVKQLPNLNGADFYGVDFKWADLKGADRSGADLQGANLSNTNLSAADLRWANLMEANLKDAYLRDTTIDGTILVEANLTGTKLIEAHLRSAYLDGDTRLDGIIGLD